MEFLVWIGRPGALPFETPPGLHAAAAACAARLCRGVCERRLGLPACSARPTDCDSDHCAWLRRDHAAGNTRLKLGEHRFQADSAAPPLLSGGGLLPPCQQNIHVANIACRLASHLTLQPGCSRQWVREISSRSSSATTGCRARTMNSLSSPCRTCASVARSAKWPGGSSEATCPQVIGPDSGAPSITGDGPQHTISRRIESSRY
jgi:hypothetical protein